MRMLPLPADAIPPGWQSVRVRVRHRLATCEETDCPFFLRGWSEVVLPSGDRQPQEAGLSRDAAADRFGLYGPAAVPPTVVEHPPGTPCGRVHKRPADLPPVYLVNGRTVLWNEFEDSLLGGWQRAETIGRERS